MPSVEVNEDRPDSLKDALDALEKASRLPAKQRITKVFGIVDTVCGHAFEQGLNTDALRTVVQIVAKKTELDQSSVTTLIKNLYPAQRVPADVVITAVGALGQGVGKPSPGSQNGLVKWLSIVYDIVDEPKALSRLYGVLFGMLDMISIRTSLCHLLSRITRRKHVRPFRIQQLLELSRGLGNEPALQGLLRVYRDYYPDIILSQAHTSRNSFAPRPDTEWQARLLAIHQASTTAKDEASEQHHGFRVLRASSKRSTASAIPEVHTFQTSQTSVTLEEIDNVEDFVVKLDRIEPPGQMISFLYDLLLQKFVDLRSDPLILRRVELWLSTCLEEEYNQAQRGEETSKYLSEILDGLYKQTQYSKTLLLIVPTFLKAYLPLWDGFKDADSLFGLLSYLPLQSFEDLHRNFFSPVEQAVLNGAPQTSYKIINCYTELLRRWMIQFGTNPSHHTSSAKISGPDQQRLEMLVSHVSKLAVSLTLSTVVDSDAPLTSSILSFYETLSMPSKPDQVPILIPPPHLTYILSQSSSVTTLSRIYGVFADNKNMFHMHPKPLMDADLSAFNKTFNCCLKDLYNLIWVSKALVTGTNTEAFGCFTEASLREALGTYLQELDHEYSIGLAFGVSYSALVASLSATAWREMEEKEVKDEGYDRQSMTWHKGPVSQHKLEVLQKNGGVAIGWKEYQLNVLRWLATRGCDGVGRFVGSVVKNLQAQIENK